jgi:hypothetical protein
MSTDCKVSIYKTSVRPVLTYASETRAVTTYSQQLLRTTEMQTIMAIRGKTLGDTAINCDNEAAFRGRVG